MIGNFRQRFHPRGFLFNSIESTILFTSTVVIALLTVLILFLGVYLRLV